GWRRSETTSRQPSSSSPTGPSSQLSPSNAFSTSGAPRAGSWQPPTRAREATPWCSGGSSGTRSPTPASTDAMRRSCPATTWEHPETSTRPPTSHARCARSEPALADPDRAKALQAALRRRVEPAQLLELPEKAGRHTLRGARLHVLAEGLLEAV